jgi:hypothetical protein
MDSYLAYVAAQAEHRARIEWVERFGYLHGEIPRRRRPPRLPVGLRLWRSRRPDGRLNDHHRTRSHPRPRLQHTMKETP